MWPALIAAGASLAGGYLANRGRKQEAARNRRFQQDMRSTSWQTAVADMEAAGINPALAYSQGPAATPGGSMASQEDVISPAVSSAMQAKRLKADLKVAENTASKTKWDAKMAEARLKAYGIDVGPSGRLMFKDLSFGELPRMTKEIDASIDLTRQRALREGYTGETLKPLADLSNNLGQILPALYLVSQLNPGSILKGAGSLRRKPPDVKNIKNFWPNIRRR